MRNDAEDVRLLQAHEANIPWRKWGPYLKRTPVGHGPRRLQQGWKCLGLFQS